MKLREIPLMGWILSILVLLFIIVTIIGASMRDSKSQYIRESIHVGKMFKGSEYAEQVEATLDMQIYKISQGFLGMKPTNFVVRNDTIIKVWRGWSLP